MKKGLKLWEAIATFVGTIIGAGILGIPYVVAQAGLWTGVAVIIGIGLVSIMLYLYLGEVTLRTRGFHQLTGYAEKYVGKWGKKLMTFSMIFGIYGALIAYIIGEGEALGALFGLNGSEIFNILGFSVTWNILFSLIFFVIVSYIVYAGLNAVGGSEMVLLPIMLIVVFIISAFAFFHVDSSNFTAFSWGKILAPYGVILFAYLGATAVPEMEQELVKNKGLMKKAVIIGTVIPIIIYLIFAMIIVGVTGTGTTQVATIGLGEIMGQKMVVFGNIFAVFAMATSFLALALALQQMYQYDYDLNKKLSWALTCLIPLVIAISGITSFIGVIGLGGVIAGGIDGVLIVIMAHKAKKYGDRKPEYSMPVNWFFSAVLIALFLLGAGYYFYSII